MSESGVKLIIKNCEQIVQVCCNGEKVKKGKNQDEVAILKRRDDGIGCSIAVGNDGCILNVDFDDKIHYTQVDTVINGFGCCVIPGLIDPHTHPIWAGDRLFEFDAKMRGDSYIDIHKKGGGIYFTVEQTKSASQEQLLELFLSRINAMAACGTTLVECKTGYGLELKTEIKMLEVLKRAKSLTQLDLVTTFLGAHACPKGMSSQESTDSVIEMMKKIGETKSYEIEFVDVFCETGVFDVQQTQQILAAGKKFLKAEAAFHGDELTPLGSAQLAAKIGVKSISHLEFIDDNGINAMSLNDTVAILCPTTLYLLKLKSPPVRKMIDQNVAVAIGSDFNPNAFCYSLPMAMNIGVVQCGLTLNEALVATTINAAYALNRSHSYGSLEVGKYADCVIINANDWRNIIYQFGDTKSIIKHVIKKGNVTF